MKGLMLNWPLIIATTVVLYVFILIMLPFNILYATVALFMLIAFWSRLLGVSIPHPFFILYHTDLVDLFALILAINLGPGPAIFVVFFGNLWSRACGVYPEWGAVFSDTLSMSTTCLLSPLFFALTGGDILMTMIIFTFVRFLLWQPFDMLFFPVSIAQKVMMWIVELPAMMIINSLYAQFFGGFLDGLLQSGAVFSWPLFFIATIVILVFYILLFGQSKNVGMKQSLSFAKKVVKNVKKKAAKKQPKKRDSQMDELQKLKKSL